MVFVRTLFYYQARTIYSRKVSGEAINRFHYSPFHNGLYISFLLAFLAPDLCRGEEIHFILYRSFLLAFLAPNLWRGQEILFSLYRSFLLAFLAPDLWRGQEILFSLYISFLLAFLATDLCKGLDIHSSLYISFLLAPIAPGSQILNCFKDLYDACLHPLPPAMWDYVLTRTEIYYIGSHGWSIMLDPTRFSF